MQYVTSFERRGLKKGIQQGIQQGLLQKSREAVLDILQVRFELVPDDIVEAINSLEDLAVLKELLKKAATTGSVEEFAVLPELNI